MFYLSTIDAFFFLFILIYQFISIILICFIEEVLLMQFLFILIYQFISIILICFILVLMQFLFNLICKFISMILNIDMFYLSTIDAIFIQFKMTIFLHNTIKIIFYIWYFFPIYIYLSGREYAGIPENTMAISIFRNFWLFFIYRNIFFSDLKKIELHISFKFLYIRK